MKINHSFALLTCVLFLPFIFAQKLHFLCWKICIFQWGNKVKLLWTKTDFMKTYPEFLVTMFNKITIIKRQDYTEQKIMLYQISKLDFFVLNNPEEVSGQRTTEDWSSHQIKGAALACMHAGLKQPFRPVVAIDQGSSAFHSSSLLRVPYSIALYCTKI